VAIAVVGAAVVGGTSARATQDSAVIAGQSNDETNRTVINNSAFDDFEEGLVVDSLGTGAIAIEAWGGATGVCAKAGFGSSPQGDCVNTFPGDAVHGEGATNGVSGRTSNSTASGVYGQNDGTGFGVAGRAVNGTGVLADSANGTALEVRGKAKFSRSGLVTIAFPAKSATVTGVPVTSKTLVLATIQKFLAAVTSSPRPR